MGDICLLLKNNAQKHWLSEQKLPLWINFIVLVSIIFVLSNTEYQ